MPETIPLSNGGFLHIYNYGCPVIQSYYYYDENGDSHRDYIGKSLPSNIHATGTLLYKIHGTDHRLDGPAQVFCKRITNLNYNIVNPPLIIVTHTKWFIRNKEYENFIHYKILYFQFLIRFLYFSRKHPLSFAPKNLGGLIIKMILFNLVK